MADVSYEDFVRGFSGPPRGDDPDPVVLTLHSIERDDWPVNVGVANAMEECYQSVTNTVRVSASGNLSVAFESASAMQGDGKSLLPKEAFQQIQSLLDQFPGDGGRLPPPGHKLVVKVTLSGVTTVWVYDRANLPDAILTILRLTKARIQVLTPAFTPTKVWPPEEAQGLALPPRSQGPKDYLHSSDWTLGVTITAKGEYLVRDEEDHRVLSKLDGLALKPDGLIYIQSVSFSPDGSQLAVFSGPDDNHKRHLTVWDTHSGQMVSEFWPVEWASYPTVTHRPVW